MRKDVISSTWKGTSSPQAVTLSWEHLNRHTGGSNPSTHPVALPMNVTHELRVLVDRVSHHHQVRTNPLRQARGGAKSLDDSEVKRLRSHPSDSRLAIHHCISHQRSVKPTTVY